MGCCLSSTRPSATDQHHHRRYPLPDPAVNDRAPPPVDEETVKEVVLSETPISKPLSNLPDENEKMKTKQSNGGQREIEFQQVKSPNEVPVAEVELGGDRRVVPSSGVLKVAEEILSEPSEMCSFTESISTTATERRDDDGEVNQRSPARGPPRKRRSPGDLSGGRDRSFRSPARRSAPSPEKRKPVTSSRGGQSRAMASQRRNVGPQNGAQRDSGTTRRSRSPVTHREVDTRRNARNRSPAVGESGRSPARSTENQEEKTEKPKQNDGVSEETGESLENPLVSLECFIFL